MAKNIRWKIPFVSKQGVHYRIDIYDEGKFTPVELTAGPTPFVTNENNSTDLFAPVRSHTGTMQVCTAIPSGGVLSMEDIMPDTNIARPIQLINTDNSNVIEWQGFISCDAYTQNYIGIPTIIDIPIISVLEAMSSVYIDCTRVKGLQQIRVQAYYALTELDRQCGMTDPFFSYVYYSQMGLGIWTKMLDSTILYNINEYSNRESYTYVVDGMSCKDVLERICKYMGWTIREEKTSIFFSRLGENGLLYKQALADFGGNTQAFIQNREAIPTITSEMSNCRWMGTGHKRNFTQGAKSVEVIAKLEDYRLEMSLPGIPTNGMTHSNNGVIEAYVTLDNEFNNKLTFYYYILTVRETAGGYDIFYGSGSEVDDAFNDCILSPDCDVTAQYPRKITNTLYYCAKNIGAFFGRFNFSGQGKTDWKDGLYIVAANEMSATTDHAPVIFKMDSIMSFRLVDGMLKFHIVGYTITRDGSQISDFTGKVDIKLRFGGMYWNGTSWQTQETFFTADFSTQTEEDQESGEYILNIPITIQLQGEVSIEIRGGIRGGIQSTGYYQPFYDLLLTELNLEYEDPEYITESENKENHYYRVLGTNFRGEVSINTELATTLNNRPSPSIVMDNINTPMYYLRYNNVPIRPEEELLERLSSYYGAARQRLELEVAHPTAAPLPLLKLNGINDGKMYLPLSESRDWQTDVCKLTCFEMPQ